MTGKRKWQTPKREKRESADTKTRKNEKKRENEKNEKMRNVEKTLCFIAKYEKREKRETRKNEKKRELTWPLRHVAGALPDAAELIHDRGWPPQMSATRLSGRVNSRFFSFLVFLVFHI